MKNKSMLGMVKTVSFYPMLKHKTQNLKLHRFSLSSKSQIKTPCRVLPPSSQGKDLSWTHTSKLSAQLDQWPQWELFLLSLALFLPIFGFCFFLSLLDLDLLGIHSYDWVCFFYIWQILGGFLCKLSEYFSAHVSFLFFFFFFFFLLCVSYG